MKKLLLLLACASLISCAHKNENVSESVSEKEVMETENEETGVTLGEAAETFANNFAMANAGEVQKIDSLSYFIEFPSPYLSFEYMSIKLKTFLMQNEEHARQVFPFHVRNKWHSCLIRTGGRIISFNYLEDRGVFISGVPKEVIDKYFEQ